MKMEEMLSFLRELEEHNDRDWFHAHEEGYRLSLIHISLRVKKHLPYVC